MKKDSKIFAYVILMLCTTAIFFICYGKIKLSEPLDYYADPIYAYTQIKTIMDYGWHMKNPLLGGGDYNLYTFTTGNTGDFIIVKIISMFTDNIFLVYNLHLYLTYILASIAAYFFLRRNSCEKIPAITMALLFSFLPYHQLRMGHSLWLSCYFVCPLFLHQALQIMSETEKKIEKRWLLQNGILLVAISLFNIYYTFFGCIIIGSAFLARVFREKGKNILYVTKKMLCVYGFIVLGTAINFGDTIFYNIFGKTNLSGAAVANRLPQTAETFSFKLIQLFLPQYNHRNEMLRNIARGYYNTTNSHFEGMFAACGIVISIGIIILLFLLFAKNIDSSVQNVATLNLWIILVGTVGGLGCMIAYIFPMIRSYARIGVYIACCSIFMIGRIISRLGWKKWAKYLICIFVLVIGIYDQTENFDLETQQSDILRKNADMQFVSQINEICENGDEIFQLPYQAFPNGAFEHLKGYLFSDKDLIWSYGNGMGTRKAVWAETIASLETSRLVAELSNRSYNGIWISKPAWLLYYSEQELQNIISELKQVVGEPIVSEFGDFYYFDITGIVTDNAMKEIYYANRAADVVKQEIDGATFFWNEQNTEFVFYNDNDTEITVTWDCKIASIVANQGHITVSVNGEVIKEQMIGKEEELSFSFTCLPGENIVSLISDIKSIGNPIGARNSSFYIKGLQIEDIRRME
ncbi:MAG: hypothetical protein PUB98_06705 [Clostridiales bacterium]|nr:hypothetical protein [Clostridiales bacterium]